MPGLNFAWRIGPGQVGRRKKPIIGSKVVASAEAASGMGNKESREAAQKVFLVQSTLLGNYLTKENRSIIPPGKPRNKQGKTEP